MRKKVLSLFLSLCLLLVPLPLRAQAETLVPPAPLSRELTLEDLWGANTVPYSAGRPWKDGSFSDGVYQGYYAQLDHTQQVIYDLLVEAFSHPTRTARLSFPEDIVPYFPDEEDDWTNLQAWIEENLYTPWTLVYNDHPEISWMLGSYTADWADWIWKYDQDGEAIGGCLTGLDVTVTYPWYTDEIYEKPYLLTQGVEEALAVIGQPKSSWAVTVKAIHDYVCNRITYNVRSVEVAGPDGETKTVYYDQLAFSGLTYPYEAVCSGYTMAFKLLCDQYGIPCVRIVGGTEEGSPQGHAWNYVQLEDGKWYVVDTTWDDDPLRYDYFLLGSDTMTPRGMPFSQDHVLSYEYIDAAPVLNPSAYPYIEAELRPASSQVTYGDNVSVAAENIHDILGRPVLWGDVELYAAESEQVLAVSTISDGMADLTYDTTTKRLPAGEHTLFVRCTSGDYAGAILGSFSLTLDPAFLTAQLDAGSPLLSKDFDGSSAFSAIPLILEGVRPEDIGAVTAMASGYTDSAQAGQRLFTAETVTMSGASGGFYRVSNTVTGMVTIQKIVPKLTLRAFPAVQNQGKKVTLTVQMQNSAGGFPSEEQVELMGPEDTPLHLIESPVPGVYTAVYTLPASLEAGETLTFTAAVTSADNYLESPHDAFAPATVTVSSRQASFVDTDPDAWYDDAVSFVYNYGLMSGVSSTQFVPGGTTSRGMIATILYQMAGCPEVSGQPPFPDVPAGKWYSNSVTWAANKGIVGGYSNGKFGPNDPITREQFALMLYKFAGSPEPGEEQLSFVDANQISSYARKALCWAVNNGIISGKEGNRLDPNGKATRAQSAVMIMRYYEKISS